MPAFCTANGRVMLATLPEAQMLTCRERLQIEPLTEHTIVDKQRPAQEIARPRSGLRHRQPGALELGLRAIAVPLRNFRNVIVAAMNVIVHESRVPLEEIVERCLPALLKAQVELGALL